MNYCRPWTNCAPNVTGSWSGCVTRASTWPLHANFIMFGVFEDRTAVWKALLEQQILIRETGPEGWLRVTVGTAQETAAFRAALLRATGRR